jgi:hypothetical protein
VPHRHAIEGCSSGSSHGKRVCSRCTPHLFWKEQPHIYDMFHDVFAGYDGYNFTVCLCFSPDLDGYVLDTHFATAQLETISYFRNTCSERTICFTICLFITPDLDGHRVH